MLRTARQPNRIFVYCHDTFGMGNARRMMTISSHLAEVFPQANLLLASGSPVIHGFRMPARLDYIKLPSVARTDRERYAARSLTTNITDTIHLRSALLRTAVADFEPDLVLVDKKPLGLLGELKEAHRFMHRWLPRTRHVLVLRDILDAPRSTIPYLIQSGFEAAVARYYDRVAVLGTPDVFDLPREYRFKPETAAQVTFCGYLRTQRGPRSSVDVRTELGLGAADTLLLATAGGGDDSGPVLDATVDALTRLSAHDGGERLHALIVAGPQTGAEGLARIRDRAGHMPGVRVLEFTDDMASYIAAADLVVCMGGYNAVCEALSLAQRAIVVPRSRPVEEQRLRAERMAALGFLRSIEPERLSGALLAESIATELRRPPARVGSRARLRLDGLANLVSLITDVMAQDGEFRRRPARAAGSTPAVTHLHSAAVRGPA